MYLLAHLLLGETVVTSVIFLFISIISQVSHCHYLLLCITNISRPTTSEVIIAFQGRLSGLHLAHSDGWKLNVVYRHSLC